MRLLIIDDHPIICEALRHFLERYADIHVVGIARNGLEGLEQLRLLNPDCVIIDLGLPQMSGIASIPLYLKERPQVGIIVFSGHTEEHLIFQALQAGARAYVLKSSPFTELATALREVNKGGYWLSPELNPAIIRSFLHPGSDSFDTLADYRSLSMREQQVFILLASGKTVKEAGDILCISPKTVAKHKIAIMNKLKVKNAAEMTLFATQHGIAL